MAKLFLILLKNYCQLKYKPHKPPKKMKNLITSFLLLAVFTLSVNAQNAPNSKTIKVKKTTESKVVYIDSEPDKSSFQYMTGSDKISGYEIRICNFSDSKLNPVVTKVFSNGKSAPILQVYVSNKAQYIGGVLENEKGKKTLITDITLTEKGTTLIFTVSGKDFSMSFNLENGSMLKEDSEVTVFNTDKVGIWKINKKK